MNGMHEWCVQHHGNVRMSCDSRLIIVGIDGPSARIDEYDRVCGN